VEEALTISLTIMMSQQYKKVPVFRRSIDVVKHDDTRRIGMVEHRKNQPRKSFPCRARALDEILRKRLENLIGMGKARHEDQQGSETDWLETNQPINRYTHKIGISIIKI
jgi:hypothetical protein